MQKWIISKIQQKMMSQKEIQNGNKLYDDQHTRKASLKRILRHNRPSQDVAYHPCHINNNNSIFIYLLANLIAQRPLTKLARVKKERNNKTLTNKIQNKTVYIIVVVVVVVVIIIIIIILLFQLKIKVVIKR
jgi:hypothetical protein